MCTRHHPVGLPTALIPIMQEPDGQGRPRAGAAAMRWEQGPLGADPDAIEPGMSARRAAGRLALPGARVPASGGDA
jgi:hypothetical protein